MSGILKTAREQGEHAGYQQAMSDVLGMLSEIGKKLSEHLGLAEYRARMETLQHVRATVRARANKRNEARKAQRLLPDPDEALQAELDRFAPSRAVGVQLYLLDDGAEHWVIARSRADALAVYLESEMGQQAGEPAKLEDCVEVSRERAALARFYDEQEYLSSMLAELERDPTRRYVACSEW